MWPIIAAVAVTGIAQAWAGSQAADAQDKMNKLNASERSRIQVLINQLKDPTFQGSLSPADIQALIKFDPVFAERIVMEAPETLPLIASSEPELFSSITEASPQVANFLKENMPELIDQAGISANEGRKAQEAALQALRKAGTEGDMISKLEQARARETVATQEAGQRGAITEEMARRGQSGGGQELLMKLAGQQSSQQNMADMAMKSQEAAIRNRLGALAQGAGIGGQMLGQDIAVEQSNKDIINSYNQRNTAAQRQIEAQRVADMNSYQAREAQAQRQRDMANTGIQNQQAQRETDYARNRANQQWSADESHKANEAQYDRARAVDQANTINQANVDYRNQNLNMTLAERARKDDQEQQRFSNDLSKINAAQGVASQNIAANNAQAAQASQAAQNQAQFIGQAAQAGVGAYGAYQQGQMDDVDRQIKEAELKRLRGY